MTAQDPHPSPEQLLQWIERPESAKDSVVLEEHAKQCEQCRALIATLRQFVLARGVRRWTSPPDDLIERAITSSQETPILPSREFEATESGPTDVRGSELGMHPGARLASRVFAEGVIEILAIPEGDGHWRIRGKVRLQGSDANVMVHLVHEDHVVATSTTDASGEFSMDEFVSDSWSLEIHLPKGRALKIEQSDLGRPDSRK